MAAEPPDPLRAAIRARLREQPREVLDELAREVARRQRPKSIRASLAEHLREKAASDPAFARDLDRALEELRLKRGRRYASPVPPKRQLPASGRRGKR